PQMSRVSTSQKGGRVYLMLKIKGQPVKCLLDFGCDKTLIPLHVIKQHKSIKMKPTTKVVIAANGTRIEMAGEATVPLEIDGNHMKVEALISRDIEEVMLGQDFLINHTCVWDFNNARIFIDGRPYEPFARKGPPRCRRVYATSDVVMLPHQQMDVSARSTLEKVRSCELNYATEPHAIQPGVYIGRTLLPSSHHDLVIRAVNTSHEPRLIKKDTFLGTLSPVLAMEDENITTGQQPLREPASKVIVDSLTNELSDSQRRQVAGLVASYEDIFSLNDYDIGRTHLVEHSIDTGDHRPIRQALRRHPISHLEVIDEEVEEMLQHGVIEPAASPWASNVVLARKK